MADSMETTILSHLIYNKNYCREVFPFIDDSYFEDNTQRILFKTIQEYISNYKEPPSLDTLPVLIEGRNDIDDDKVKDLKNLAKSLKRDDEVNHAWLVDETEKFCQERAVRNAIFESIVVLGGEHKTLDKGSIPGLLSSALAISFNTSVGHDFLDDAEERYDMLHSKMSRIPFDLKMMNIITKGGLPKKSITVLVATSGAGKSIFKCHMAANALMQGKNVLYITMELSEEEVSKRIDANLLDETLDDVMAMNKEIFLRRINRIKEKTVGKLIVKEYPTGSAHVGHFRHLLNEMKLKKNFVPDIIMVDYINICASSRMKGGSKSQYEVIKSITEELRGLAVEFDVPVLTSTQFNRGGYDQSDPDLTNISESMGVVHTADAVFAMIATEEYDEQGQVGMKQLKNRWGDISSYRRFVLGIDKSRMKLYNLEDSAQTKIAQNVGDKKASDTPAFDKSKFGSAEFETGISKRKNLFNMTN